MVGGTAREEFAPHGLTHKISGRYDHAYQTSSTLFSVCDMKRVQQQLRAGGEGAGGGGGGGAGGGGGGRERERGAGQSRAGGRVGGEDSQSQREEKQRKARQPTLSPATASGTQERVPSSPVSPADPRGCRQTSYRDTLISRPSHNRSISHKTASASGTRSAAHTTSAAAGSVAVMRGASPMGFGWPLSSSTSHRVKGSTAQRVCD